MSTLANLAGLALDDNEIDSIAPLLDCTNLTDLYLQGNELNEISTEIYIPQLRERGVKVEYDELKRISIFRELLNSFR